MAALGERDGGGGEGGAAEGVEEGHCWFVVVLCGVLLGWWVVGEVEVCGGISRRQGPAQSRRSFSAATNPGFLTTSIPTLQALQVPKSLFYPL